MGFDLGVLIWMVGIIAVLMLVMRWVFAPSSRPHTGRPQSGPDADLGLLGSGRQRDATQQRAGREELPVHPGHSLLDVAAGPGQL